MAKSVTKRLVVSAVNFTEGGPLSALRDCLTVAAASLADEWKIVALVHSRHLFDIPRIEFIEFPKSKRSWLYRLFLEYWKFSSLSRKLRADVWLSLHDISPRIFAPKKLVYCHNPSPFYSPRFVDMLWDPGFFLFTLFYRFLYRINIHSNMYVVVQQDWIRQAFQRMYGINNIIVASPVVQCKSINVSSVRSAKSIFFYPALPRVFKNFEVLCDAAEILYQRGETEFEVRLTISGFENRYAAYLKRRYSSCPVISFIGLQSKEMMAVQYQEASALVFPSRLETWGLPISEAKAWRKYLLIADLPYAHETVGDYVDVNFFDPLNPGQLADLMDGHLKGTLCPHGSHQAFIDEPYAANWEELIRLVVDDPVMPSGVD